VSFESLGHVRVDTIDKVRTSIWPWYVPCYDRGVAAMVGEFKFHSTLPYVWYINLAL